MCIRDRNSQLDAGFLGDSTPLLQEAAPTCGVLYGIKKWLEELPPYQGGGGMIREVKKDSISYGELPNKYEAGTMATAQVIAFDESIKFMENIGIENIMKHEADLVEYGQELLQKNNSVKLIGSPKNKGGVLSVSYTHLTLPTIYSV